MASKSKSMKFLTSIIVILLLKSCECQSVDNDVGFPDSLKYLQLLHALSQPTEFLNQIRSGQSSIVPHPNHVKNFISNDWSNTSQLTWDNVTNNGPVFFPKCSDDIVQMLYNLESSWALKMIDASGKLESGLLLGSVTWTGNFKECINIYAPLDEKDHGDFSGRYCMAAWSLNISESYSNLPISAGICVPNSCESDDINRAINNVLHLSEQIPVVKNILSHVKLSYVSCKTGVQPPDAAVVIYVFIISIFLVLVFCGSSLTVFYHFQRDHSVETRIPLQSKEKKGYGTSEVEPFHATPPESDQVNVSLNQDTTLNTMDNSNSDNLLKRILLCFCAFTNGSKILKVNVPGTELASLHGFRFLSLTWVILGHTYITSVADISNKLEALKDIDSFPFQMLIQAPFSVDSFFLLSGTLLAYLFLKEADRTNGKISWLYFYLHRIWRLTPVYMLLVAFYMLIFKYTGSGPFWDDNYGDSCRHTWWWYLLYINNFIPIREMCIGWSWYLANDMQFYLLSPLFLYPLWRWPKIGISLIISCITICSIITGVLVSEYDIVPMLSGVTEVTDLMAYQDKMWDSFDIIYDKPYCRIGAYLIGILLGYALYKTGTNRNFLNWWQVVLGWSLAAFCSASVIFGLYHVHITPTISIIYNSLSRVSFVLGLSWMIYACETGHGGVIHSILSWKFWVPLSRLTYCAYLVHPVLVHGYYKGLQAPLYFTHTTVVTMFLGVVVAAYILAFAVSFTFESPMMNLEKLLLKRSNRQ